MSTTHKAKILSTIMQSGAKTAANFNISNGNQYMIELEKEGIIYSYWMQDGKKRFKLRDIFNHTKANAFLKKYRESQQDQVKAPDDTK
ncbi:MAG: hypothetical protein NTY39_00205 [Campylobacterales bacterium]|nr:hypothetical protein [Campylobacterales bacterium]